MTGKSFEHRKAWVRERLQFLAAIFTLEVLAYAVMSNHLHLLLRVSQAALDALSDQEVARRWLLLYPRRRSADGTACTPEEVEVTALANDSDRIKKLRERLGSISWLMKSINEYIARQANYEDECKGRFWEGRFKSQRIASEAAALQCAIYIDLNPIRAKIAKTPEESLFTSAWERIEARGARLELEAVQTAQAEVDAGSTAAAAAAREMIHARLAERAALDSWLTPIQTTQERRGFLSIPLDQYLALLDWTGRQLRAGKRGRIPPDLAPILKRLSISADGWVDSIEQRRNWFYRFVGDAETMTAAAACAGMRWFKGLAAARRLFLPAAAEV